MESHCVSKEEEEGQNCNIFWKNYGKVFCDARGTYWLISCPESRLSVQFAVFKHSRN
jgi:hypothetical protein